MFNISRDGALTQERRRRTSSLTNLDEIMRNSENNSTPYIPGRATPHPFTMQDLDPSESPKQQEAPLTLRSCLTKEPLLLFTLIGVVSGVLVGSLLRPANLNSTTISLIGFPGELMLSLLKMLVLPLVAASMISGMCSLRESGNEESMKRLAKLTAAFYILSTVVAIVLGLLLVSIIRPGKGASFNKVSPSSGGGCRGNDAALIAKHQSDGGGGGGSSDNHSGAGGGGGATEALLHVARLIVPSNVVQAAVDMNVLGIITFSLLFGWALSSLGPQAAPLIRAAHTINAAVGKMVIAALWISPLGVGCLIASSILHACDLSATISALGLWLATVILGLAIFAFIILPAFLFAATGKSPLPVASYYGQALALAFGTSSSAAALPLAMAGAKEAGCDPSIISFFLPLGIAINMNGTALYEATTALFIAQAHGVSLGPAEVVVVAATASLAAVGAPAIPSAGLVTMLIVLQAVGLDQFSGDLAVILAADWLLDRLRTAVNLLSDGFGCVVVDHWCRKQGEKDEEFMAGVGGVRGGYAYSHVEMGSVRGDDTS
ncbi:hypothetical protein Ndes2437A_g09104 [Nannochloris sp. 'desiccata']